MSSKMEADYKKAVEVEQQNRTKEQLLHSLDKIRSPISVCEITKDSTKILFANHTWSFLAGMRQSPSLFPQRVSTPVDGDTLQSGGAERSRFCRVLSAEDVSGDQVWAIAPSSTRTSGTCS